MSDFLQFAVVLAAALAVVYYTGHGPFLLRKTTEIVYGKPGCAPVPAIGNVTLHYFAARGRGEPIRMILEEAKIFYNETGFTKDTWPEAKAKGIEEGLYTFGQVPAITTSSGVQMVQSQAITHYIGRSTGMECNCEDLHFCEAVALAVEDIAQKFGKVVYDPEFTIKSRNDYLKDTASVWLGYLEKIAPCLEAKDKAFFASERLTWVDFLVFNIIDVHIELAQVKIAGVAPINILENHPKLSAFYSKFKARPKIAVYLESSRRPAFNLPYPPKAAIPQQKAAPAPAAAAEQQKKQQQVPKKQAAPPAAAQQQAKKPETPRQNPRRSNHPRRNPRHSNNNSNHLNQSQHNNPRYHNPLRSKRNPQHRLGKLSKLPNRHHHSPSLLPRHLEKNKKNLKSKHANLREYWV
ncbi:uncharacterized protein [Ptychodera flava]|uniref:uncharacterized protein n=1 Tax=Ptychodera flava TaxID=63121 RepID=UPI00396A4F29